MFKFDRASKAALESFSKVVAREEASKGIRSNNICPGVTITSVFDRVICTDNC